MRKKDRRRDPARGLMSAVMLFYFLGFFLLFLQKWDWQALLLSALVPGIILFGVVGLPKLFPADRLLLSLTNFLCALGVLILYRLSPARGIEQAINYGVGVGCMMLTTLLVRYIKNWKYLVLLMIVASLALLALPVLIGEEKNGAKNWIALGGMSLQPSEIVKLALLLSLAYTLSRRQVILSIVFAGACLGLLMLEKDLGTALLYYGVTLVMLYAATGSFTLVGLGALGGCGAAVVGYQMFSHVRTRVAIWQNPWSDAQGKGFQIVQGLIAIANGGTWGVGLGLGNASIIPESYNDYIFSVIVHEFGLIFGVIVLLMYLAIVVRGVMIALRANSRMYSLLAAGCAALIALQMFVIIGGNIKLIPLTGVTLPFISSGGTSMVSSLCVIGLIQGVSGRNKADAKQDEALAMLGGDER